MEAIQITEARTKAINTMSSAAECINVYKAFQEINNVLFKFKAIELTYFKAWCVLIQTQYYLTLPFTYMVEAQRIIKDNIINVNGELNEELINSIVMDEL